MCCCVRFTILTDCYELFTEKINPWTIVRTFLTCEQICPSFHGSVTVSASCDELFTDTSELLRILAIDYELAIRKDS